MTATADAGAVRMLRLPSALLLLSALALAGCSGGEAHGTVTLRDNEFDPTTLTVGAGDEVHFEMASGAKNPHTVTIHKAGDPPTTLLHDERLEAGGDAHFSFPAPGTYHVWCTLHGQMTSGMAMVVTVE